jgi:hypothetical protein
MKNRKLTVPKPLQNLTQEQLGQVHAWFSRFTYREMVDKIRDAFNVVISVNQLTRYYARFAQANLYNTVLYTPLTPEDMAAIQNAEPIPEHISMARLKEQCLRIVKRPDIDAFDLKALHDVVTYEQRLQWKQHRNDIDEQTNSLRDRRLDLRQRQLAFQKDQAEWRQHLCQLKAQSEAPSQSSQSQTPRSL